MSKLGKIKIGNLFTTIFLINTVILSIIITLLFISSINNLGKFSNRENSASIKNQIATLLLHDVKIRGEYYSYLFENASSASEIIAGQFAGLVEKQRAGSLMLDKNEKVGLNCQRMVFL